MVLLIDGYNLLHAAGFFDPRSPKLTDGSRRRMLDWLAAGTAGRGVLVRVVFDGLNAPAESPERDHRGVKVRFSYRETADDRIEALLAERPAGVTVVSNDGRLHEAARRRGCRAWRCDEFLDWMMEGPKEGPAGAEPDEKPADGAAEAELLKAFGEPKEI